LDADKAPHAALVFELHDAGNFGEKSVVLALADVGSGLVARAALANQNGAATDELTAKTLNPQPLAVGIAPVC